MGIILLEGEEVPVPRAGRKKLLLDASGVPYLLTPAGDREALSDPVDGSITAAKLADDAVETDKIDDGAVTEDKIGDDAVTPDKIANPWTVIGPTVGDVETLNIFTGRDGDVDGGYEIVINLAATAAGEDYALQPNGADTGCSVTYIQITPGTGVTAPALRSDLFITDAGGSNTPVAHIMMQSSQTTPTRLYECNGARTSGGGLRFQSFGNIGAAAGKITSLVLKGTSPDAIKAGSYIRWRTIRGYS